MKLEIGKDVVVQILRFNTLVINGKDFTLTFDWMFLIALILLGIVIYLSIK